MNFGHGDYIMTNTPAALRAMAAQITALGVRPEIEAFDAGHLWFGKKLAEEGLIKAPRSGAIMYGNPVGRAG